MRCCKVRWIPESDHKFFNALNWAKSMWTCSRPLFKEFCIKFASTCNQKFFNFYSTNQLPTSRSGSPKENSKACIAFSSVIIDWRTFELMLLLYWEKSLFIKSSSCKMLEIYFQESQIMYCTQIFLLIPKLFQNCAFAGLGCSWK